MARLTDKEYAAQKKRVKKYLDKWIASIGLGWWKINIEWETVRSEEDDRGSCAAEARTTWEYREATIVFYLEVVAGESDEELEYIVLHELMHVFVNEMREWQCATAETVYEAVRHEERVCTDLAKAFLWASRMKGK